MGVPAFSRMTNIGQSIDLAFIVLPADSVLDALHDCERSGVRVAVVGSAGFEETGGAGQTRNELLEHFLETHSLRVLGPNCMGLVNLTDSIAATFSQSLQAHELNPGHIALVGQSGALAGSLMDILRSRDVGLSHWVSTGNECDITAIECAEYLVEKDETRIVALFLEGLRDPMFYRTLLARAEHLGKPVVVLRSGRSQVGASAALSHTGAVAGDGAVFDAISRQAGAIVADGLDNFVDVLEALTPGRKPSGTRLAVISSSGGTAVLLADAAERRGLDLLTFSDDTNRELRSLVPENASVQNPLDLTAGFLPSLIRGDRDIWAPVCKVIANDSKVDMVVIAVTMVTGAASMRLAAEIVDVAWATDKPVLVLWLAGALGSDAISALRKGGVPVFSSPERLIDAAYALGQSASPRGENRVQVGDPTIDSLLSKMTGQKTEWSSRGLLDAMAVATPRGGLASSVLEAERIAAEFGNGRLVTLKLSDDQLAHRTRIGGVETAVPVSGIPKAWERLEAVVDRLDSGRSIPVMVVEQIDVKLELLVGITRDSEFGHVFALGPGGTSVEREKGLAFWLPPFPVSTGNEFLEWLGISEHVPAEASAGLLEVLLAAERMLLSAGDRLAEFEINPLALTHDGEWVALDVLLRLDEEP
jgi:acyl-CoA synthetase (NDP forming)